MQTTTQQHALYEDCFYYDVGFLNLKFFKCHNPPPTFNSKKVVEFVAVSITNRP